MQRYQKPTELIRIEGLRKTYSQGRWWERCFPLTALNGIDLTLGRNETLAVVGKSGSGKSTLAMCLAMLVEPDAGTIWFEGQDLLSLAADERRHLRPQIQLIFQDSVAALSPHFSAAQIIEEPLLIRRRVERRERLKIVHELMDRVGLSPRWAGRLASQFSGGQRQRLAIARALTLRPKLLILDEPFAGLDISVRAHIVNLLIELQAELGLTYLFISHDFELVEHLADRIAVLSQGKIVSETGIADGHSAVCAEPQSVEQAPV